MSPEEPFESPEYLTKENYVRFSLSGGFIVGLGTVLFIPTEPTHVGPTRFNGTRSLKLVNNILLRSVNLFFIRLSVSHRVHGVMRRSLRNKLHI